MSDLEIPDVSRSPKLHAYTSMWRLRGDAWASLADVTKRLSDVLTPDEQRPALQEEARELVRLLDPLETYWAYPGRSRLEQIALLCDIEDYESAMRKGRHRHPSHLRQHRGGHRRGGRRRSRDHHTKCRTGRKAGIPGLGRGQPARGRRHPSSPGDAQATASRGSLYLRAAFCPDL